MNLTVSHKTIYIISGIIWLLIGFMLLQLGIGFLLDGVQNHSVNPANYSSLFLAFASMMDSPINALLLIILSALVVGMIKGRVVFSKSVERTRKRIESYPNPTKLSKIYSPMNYAIIGSMMLLGFSLKYFGLKLDIRGFIDTAVGAALVQGSLGFFHLAYPVR